MKSALRHSLFLALLFCLTTGAFPAQAVSFRSECASVLFRGGAILGLLAGVSARVDSMAADTQVQQSTYSLAGGALISFAAAGAAYFLIPESSGGDEVSIVSITGVPAGVLIHSAWCASESEAGGKARLYFHRLISNKLYSRTLVVRVPNEAPRQVTIQFLGGEDLNYSYNDLIHLSEPE